MAPIPFARPDYGEAEAAAVADVVRSGWVTSGPRAAEFETQFRHYVGAPHALAVSSCTAGLHLALTALGIGPGDEVITTPLTFCATANAILQTGATPVLADVGTDLNLSPEAVREVLTKRTRAILPVHLAGLPCNMAAIWNIAREHELAVVEDAAHAAGAAVEGHSVGAGLSDAVVFSFYATKNLSTGEGGMVTTGSEELADRMRRLSLHGVDRDAWKRRHLSADTWRYDVVECGFKYNLSDLHAALGLVQLEKLTTMNARRQEIAQRYSQAFADVPGLTIAPDRKDCTHAWQLYVLRMDPLTFGMSRDEFIAEMRTLGVECSVHFIPLPLLSYYRQALPHIQECPHAIAEYRRMVSLPLYSGLRNDEVEHVIASVLSLAAVRA